MAETTDSFEQKFPKYSKIKIYTVTNLKLSIQTKAKTICTNFYKLAYLYNPYLQMANNAIFLKKEKFNSN